MVPSDLPRELVEMQVYTPTSEAWKSRIWSCILVLYSLVFSSITVYLSLNTAMITSEGEAGEAMMMMGTLMAMTSQQTLYTFGRLVSRTTQA